MGRFSWPAWAALAGLMLIYLATVAGASRRLSPAMDEAGHLRSGLAQLTRGAYVDVKRAWWTSADKLHPPIDMLPAAVARAAGQSPDLRGDHFLSFGVIRVARWVSHLGGALTLLVVFLWGRRLWRAAGGLLAAALLAFNPLFLAHATIVSSDLTMTLGGLMAAWALWRIYLADRRAARDWGKCFWTGAVLAGLALAFGVVCKVSNLLFVATAPAVTLWGAWLARDDAEEHGGAWLARGLAAGALVDAIALATAAVVYGMPDLYEAPFEWMGRRWMLPVGQGLAVCATWAMRLGELLPSSIFYKGWLQNPSPKHYLAAFLYKTPLPLLALMGLGWLAALGAVRRNRGDDEGNGATRRQARAAAVTLLAALVAFMTLSFTTRGFYLGLRHLLLPITLGTVLAGALGMRNAECGLFFRYSAFRTPHSALRTLHSAFRILLFLFFLWSAAIVARTWPWYLSYFNPLAGDRLVLVDSDGDWGQGLWALADWQREHSPDAPIWLSYFGDARPQDYGVRYRGLLSPFAPGLTLDPDHDKGRDPARLSGWVAISASQLSGRFMWEVGRTNVYYEPWLKLRPAAKIAGGTIWIYDRRGP